MLLAIVLTFILYAISCRPTLHGSISNNGEYMSIANTRVINAFFILIVLSSHICHHTPQFYSELCAGDYFYVKHIVRKIGQLMVAPFFFISGYGIMYSFVNKAGYAASIVKRSIQLLIFFNVALLLYLTLNVYIGHPDFVQSFSTTRYLALALAWDSCGNQNWFIFATLMMYVACVIVFNLTAPNKQGRVLLCMLVLSVLYIGIVGALKEYFWVDTVMCFPLGMAFFCYRTRIEELVRKLKIPIWVCGIALVLSAQLSRYFMLSCIVHQQLELLPAVVLNLISAVFALGIILIFSCVSWTRQPRILQWMGGPGLFPIYIFHSFFILLLSWHGLHTIEPNLYILLVILGTGGLAVIFSLVFKQIGSYIYKRPVKP